MKNVINERGFISHPGATSLSVDCSTTFNMPVTMTSLTASLDKTMNRVFVDMSGDDVTGDGTFSNPYRTVAKALAVVSASSPTLTNRYGISIGAGKYNEDSLNVPDYTGVYGIGIGTTVIAATQASVPVFTIAGVRTRLERLTILGVNTGSNNDGVLVSTPEIPYIDAVRMQNLTIRQCSTGVHVSSGSSANCFDVRCWDDLVGFYSDNASSVDLYECNAYQLSDLRAAGTVGLRSTCEIEDQYVYLFSFNTWNNETAIYVDGTTSLNGGFVYGTNLALEAEDVGIKIDDAARVDFNNVWSKDVVSFDIEQRNVSSRVALRNAQMNFNKLSLITGGESNVQFSGVDVDDIDVFRLRGPDPAFQLRNLQTSVMSGGLFRIALEPAHLCIERNTHPSGTFATYVEDLLIDPTGSVSIGDQVNWNRLDVSGSIGVRNAGSVKLYESAVNGSSNVSVKAPDSLTSNSTYTMPAMTPASENEYLVCSTQGILSWSSGGSGTGEVNSGSNIGSGLGVYAQKNGVALEFKTLKTGSNVTMTSDADSITISATPTGEVNSGSNLGTGEGVYTQKNGVALEFRSLVAGSNVSFTTSSTEISIAATVGETNVGENLDSGFGIYSGKSGVALQFKSLKAGTNVTLSSGSNTITIDATVSGSGTGEVNTGANLGAGGAGFGVYSGKSGVILEFKSLIAGTNISFTSSSTSITMNSENVVGQNLASDFGLYTEKSGSVLQFKSLSAGTGMLLTSGSNSVQLSSTAVLTASNVGSGSGVSKSVASGTLELKTLIASSSSLGNVLLVSSSLNEISFSKRTLSNTLTLEDDFVSNSNIGAIGWTTTTNGAGAAAATSDVGVDAANGAIGVIALATGTNSSGRTALMTSPVAFSLNAMTNSIIQWRLGLSALSTVAQEYRVKVGFIDVSGAGESVDGVFFEYDRLTAGDLWRICVANNSVLSKTTTIIPVTTSFATLRIEITGTSSARYYVNDVLAGTISSGLPSGAGRQTGLGVKIEKTAGTTSRIVYCDYVMLHANLAVAR
jgi:hypothetical protein